MSRIFERFVEKTPVSVMARAAMEHAMAPEALDALFVKHANKQYTRALLGSRMRYSEVGDVIVSQRRARILPFCRSASKAARPLVCGTLQQRGLGICPDIRRPAVSRPAALASAITATRDASKASIEPVSLVQEHGSNIVFEEIGVSHCERAGRLPHGHGCDRPRLVR